MRTFVQYGTGNIGRSLMGQLFSRAGYEVIFIGRNQRIIETLNREGRYLVEVKDEQPDEIWVEHVRGILASDRDRVIEAIARADLMATAVGPNSLPQLYDVIAAGILKRSQPLNILICENLRWMSRIFRAGLLPYLPADYPFDERVGLIETSIGKMVPIMPEEIQRAHPTRIWAEAYNLLLVDKRGFVGEIPQVEGMIAKANFDACVDQKLFVHNLGHATIAYLGYLMEPSNPFIWKAISHPAVEQVVRGAMWESANALIDEYPGEFTTQTQHTHIEDLIRRFKNQFLNDTLYRVGRDLPRKLGPDERLVGAAKMALKHRIPPRHIALAIAAGFRFRATDERGELFDGDRLFHAELVRRGLPALLQTVCSLDSQRDRALIELIERSDTMLRERKTSVDLSHLLE